MRIILLLILVATTLYSCRCDCEREYNPPRWKRNVDFRYLIVNDLMKSKKLDTFNKENIRSALGEPDKVQNNSNLYVIGIPKGKLPPEPSCLIVEFDNSGKVSNYYVSNCE